MKMFTSEADVNFILQIPNSASGMFVINLHPPNNIFTELFIAQICAFVIFSH